MSTISDILEGSETPEYRARTGWISFFFDSNVRCGLVEGPVGLVRFAKAWMRDSGGRSLDEFLGALEASRRCPDFPPKFGFRSECTGPRTLQDLLDANGLDLDWLREATSGP